MSDLGKLDRRIQLQRFDHTTIDSYGELQDVWQNLGGPRWASRFPVNGARAAKLHGVQTLPGKERVMWLMRWSRDIADLSPQDRIAYGSVGTTESPTEATQYYNITSIHEAGGRGGLKVFSERETVP